MSRGISRFKYQLWLFGLSAFFTGLAGAFYAVNFAAVGPIVFSISMLLFLLSMIVVGGIGTVLGPLLGGALLMLADEAMREVGDWRDIGLGLILAGFVILLPRGLVGLRVGPLARGVACRKVSELLMSGDRGNARPQTGAGVWTGTEETMGCRYLCAAEAMLQRRLGPS